MSERIRNMNGRHIPVASIRAVEALAEANGARVIRAEGYASTTLPDGATYFWSQ